MSGMKGGAFGKRTIRDVPLDGAIVLVRADYNVPQADDGSIDDDFRLKASLPTLRYLIARQCRVIICAHLGRPEGQNDDRFSLESVAERLGQLLGQPVRFVPDCVGDRVTQAVKRTRPGEVVLLENLRFHAEEEANDPVFAKALATSSGATYFVQDGFGVVHRAHASTDAITHYLPGVAGLLLEREVLAIHGALEKPKRPLVAVLGGAKVSDKIEVVERFIALADHIVIGGAMANTFLAYKGLPVGTSKCETDMNGVMKKIYTAAEKKVGQAAIADFLLLPTDVAVAASPSATARRTVVTVQEVSDSEMILDIGPSSIDRAVAVVQAAGTVVWNGTLGYAELPQFAHGSARVALALATHPDVTSVIGGGDTADFVLDWDGANGASFSHVSTGGGASLDLMAGKPMPGIDALLDV
ncbi:MAG TPA: phosphoglycerate kinase [Candidatus Saccharimonadales bacterium]|jgi:phosphoglycerate kinase